MRAALSGVTPRRDDAVRVQGVLEPLDGVPEGVRPAGQNAHGLNPAPVGDVAVSHALAKELVETKRRAAHLVRIGLVEKEWQGGVEGALADGGEADACLEAVSGEDG